MALPAVYLVLLPRIGLAAETTAAPGEAFSFEVDPVWRLELLNGWDDIDLTQNYRAESDKCFSSGTTSGDPGLCPAARIKRWD